jgi:hypothetical protein
VATGDKDFVIRQGLQVNGGLIFAAGGQSNVGINNTAPDAMLHVTGTANIASNLTIQGTLTVQGNVTLSGTNTYISSTNVVINNTVTITSNLTLAGANNTISVTNTTVTANVTFNTNVFFGSTNTENSMWWNGQWLTIAQNANGILPPFVTANPRGAAFGYNYFNANENDFIAGEGNGFVFSRWANTSNTVSANYVTINSTGMGVPGAAGFYIGNSTANAVVNLTGFYINGISAGGSSAYPPGTLYGMIPSWVNGQALAISNGVARDQNNSLNMIQSNTLTKTNTGTWTQGNNQHGGLANTALTTYGIYSISNGTAFDIFYGMGDPTPASLPSGWQTYYRRIGWFITDSSGNIQNATWFDDEVVLANATLDVAYTTLGNSSVTFTLSAPNNTMAHVRIAGQSLEGVGSGVAPTVSNIAIIVRATSMTDVLPSQNNATLVMTPGLKSFLYTSTQMTGSGVDTSDLYNKATANGWVTAGAIETWIQVDNSSQIAARGSTTSSVNNSVLNIETIGWRDRRHTTA